MQDSVKINSQQKTCLTIDRRMSGHSSQRPQGELISCTNQRKVETEHQTIMCTDLYHRHKDSKTWQAYNHDDWSGRGVKR